MTVPVVRVKDGVTFKMSPGGIRILSSLDRLAFGLGRDVVITCGADSHPPEDPHTRGDAYDIRTAGDDDETIKRKLLFLRNDLGPWFTVIHERTQDADPGSPLAGLVTVNPRATGQHIHAQVKKGTAYPPTV